MIRTVIGVVLASIVIFVWGFIYWGMGPFPTLIWKQATDHETASRALREQFPERGTYFVPGHVEDSDDSEARFRQGPVALVHMLHPEGRSMFDPLMLGQGFVLNLVVVGLVAVLLHSVSAAIPSYLGRVGLVTLAGLIASLVIDGGDIVWWQIPWEWKLYQAAYNISVWIIAGVILAAFVGKRSQASAG